MAANILIVDESPTLRNTAKIYLQNLRHSLLEAEDAERALQMLRLVPVSLIIVDSALNGMSAISFISSVRDNPVEHVKAIPIIVIAALSEADTREKVLAVGANAVVGKPLNHAELTAAVKRLLPAG